MKQAPVATAISRGPTPDFFEVSARYLEEYLEKIERAVECLDPSQVWWRPNEHANSVGNLLVHLVGNLSLWILQSLGNVPYERHRSAEFAARDGESAPVLVAALGQTVGRCRSVLARLGAADLDRRVEVQGYSLTLRDALFHAVEHMSYHTGQIVWVAKELARVEDLEFYPQHAEE